MCALKFQKIIENPDRASAIPLLRIRNLSVSVGIRKVLENISLEIFSGEHVRITGANGSGKSTLLNAISGIEPARIDCGIIEFNGCNLSGQPAHVRTTNGLAYMPQTDNIFPSLTVSENLKIALGENGHELFREAFPEWEQEFQPTKHAGLLSGGQKKKLAWAITVLRPGWKVLLLDEPRAGVQAGKLNCNFSLEGRCILEIEHNCEEVKSV